MTRVRPAGGAPPNLGEVLLGSIITRLYLYSKKESFIIYETFGRSFLRPLRAGWSSVS